jgi:hypothetical protein
MDGDRDTKRYRCRVSNAIAESKAEAESEVEAEADLIRNACTHPASAYPSNHATI